MKKSEKSKKTDREKKVKEMFHEVKTEEKKNEIKKSQANNLLTHYSLVYACTLPLSKYLYVGFS